jgi:hypothetical protein
VADSERDVTRFIPNNFSLNFLTQRQALPYNRGIRGSDTFFGSRGIYMKRSVLRQLRVWLPILTLLLFVIPVTAFADALCLTGSTGGPCPGFFAGSPFAVPFLPVPESLSQMILPAGVFVTAGDVLVFDDPAMTVLGDVLRFPDIGGGVAHFVILLSDVGDPVDTGLPSSFQANTFSMIENAGGPTLYTAGPGGQVYNILSDAEIVPDVPEPGTFLLMGLAGFCWAIRIVCLKRLPRFL